MLSNIFSRFGTKPKPRPIAPRATVERTDWYVLQPLHTVRFEDKAWGLQWCEQHGFAPRVLQERLSNLDEEKTIAQENTFNNMFENAERGNGFPSIPENTPCIHLDNYFAAFQAQPQMNATGSLLAMAFSVNRVDVAQYIGSLLTHNVAHWIKPLSLQPYEDPVMFEQANNAFMQGFKSMMAHPRQMQWFFEHNPMLYTQLNTPKNLAKLEIDIVCFPEVEAFMWPAVAHTVFAHDVQLVSSSAISFYSNPTDSDTLNTLLLSYTHSPAAQCTLMRMAKDMNWFYQHENMRVSTENTSPFISPEAIALRKYFQKESLVGVDADVVKRVHLLNMGLHENTHNAFYQHAQLIFAPAPLLTLNLPELEAGVW